MQISGKSFAAGVLVTMVLGSGTAYAATGGNFILGKTNSATTKTVLNNGYGTALHLGSKAGTPPLTVNQRTKIPYLNVDQLDGYEGASFARNIANTGAYWSTEVFPVDFDEDGFDDHTIAYVDCPVGTVVTGGSAFSYEGSNILDNYKDGNGWIAISDDPLATTDFGANAVCWNPKGPLADQSFRTAPKADLREAARRAVR